MAAKCACDEKQKKNALHDGSMRVFGPSNTDGLGDQVGLT
jgi:hypothetical protein